MVLIDSQEWELMNGGALSVGPGFCVEKVLRHLLEQEALVPSSQPSLFSSGHSISHLTPAGVCTSIEPFSLLLANCVN